MLSLNVMKSEDGHIQIYAAIKNVLKTDQTYLRDLFTIKMYFICMEFHKITKG